MKLIALALAVTMTGCATTQSYNPVVDPARTSGSYYQDLRECKNLAETQPSEASRAVAGALVGALLFAALGAAAKADRNQMAGIGAIAGGAQGFGQGVQSQQSIINNCLRGRGHNPLN